MLSAENLASIEQSGRHIGRLARAQPGAAVPQYPGWVLEDLANHLGWVHGRMVTICRQLPRERVSGPRCPEGMAPVDWYEQTLEEMLGALEGADPSAPVYGFGEMATIGFWERRMVIETGVHRWDADQAMGDDVPLEDQVAISGLDEFAEIWASFLGEVRPLVAEATDLGRAWTLSGDPPADVVRGTASNIYLRLMARPSPVVLPDDWAAAVDSLAPPPKP